MTLEEENASLKEQLAAERAKNEVLLEQVLDAEDREADADVEAFSDVIPNEDREFWRDQILENREGAVACLERLRNRGAAPAAAGAPAAAPKPLHNRAAAKVGAASPAAPSAGAAAVRAGAVRNRAQEIAKRDKCSFHAAWGRAEKELGA